jgi:hypothetical protein
MLVAVVWTVVIVRRTVFVVVAKLSNSNFKIG